MKITANSHTVIKRLASVSCAILALALAGCKSSSDTGAAGDESATVSTNNPATNAMESTNSGAATSPGGTNSDKDAGSSDTNSDTSNDGG